MPRFTSELDYLVKSLDVVDTQHKTALAGLREARDAMMSLKDDIERIKTPRLKTAAVKTFNHFSVEKGKFTTLIKEIREDQKWIRRLIKTVQGAKKRVKS